ncbi:Putative acyltransferase 3 domain-containing protein [Septoria linicola]|uniref:Acyltransferase 3 domain-containing protein n=1 Tax=Septoria linicola TaxID=215465 RepID=A0A9Q9B8B2_9PEZI|nr:putative acyltransferase 3 domain-containing protein [Septoria linicola]USW58911.1 Putative acyltransferase 3 domain-containing protein [Septoria linicola]
MEAGSVRGAELGDTEWRACATTDAEKHELHQATFTNLWYRIRVIISNAYQRTVGSSNIYRALPTPGSTNPAPATRAVSRTASYDGLRGLACLVVFNFHFLYPYSNTMKHGYGMNSKNMYLHQLPILSLLVRGRAMVVLFFAISGYVLSYGFLASMRSGQSDKALSRLASLTIRRWMRLFLPATASMLLACLASYLGAFDSGRKLEKTPWITGMWEQHPPRYSTLYAQIHDFTKMWWAWQSPFVWRLYYSLYDPHTWTIPVEFKCSMVLFVLLVGSAGLKQRWKFGLVLLVTWCSLLYKRWDVATFTAGALVADLHQRAAHRKEQTCVLPLDDQQQLEPPRRGSHLKTILKWLLFLTSLYVLSFPDNFPKKTPGYKTLRWLTPSAYKDAHYFWHSVAASFIIWSVEELPPIRNFLSTSVPQYLGRTSFAFYLVHGPILHSAGFALQPAIWAATGHETTTQWCFGLLIGWVIMLPLSLGAAHVFYKLVDAPLVRVTRWLEQCALDKPASRTPKDEEKQATS